MPLDPIFEASTILQRMVDGFANVLVWTIIHMNRLYDKAMHSERNSQTKVSGRRTLIVVLSQNQLRIPLTASALTNSRGCLRWL